MTGNQAILEVIEGPMDGLNTLITQRGMVGRNVGNSLSLAYDLEVSGTHCEVVLEGASWCLSDQESTNGTWYDNKRLKPGVSTPIPVDQLFLVGSTTVQLYGGKAIDTFEQNTDPGQKSILEEFKMAGDMQKMWQRRNYIPNYGEYCDVTRLFIAMAEEMFGSDCSKYECVNMLKSNSKYRILGSCPQNINFDPFYELIPGIMMFAPRVWRVMRIAAKQKREALTIADLFAAILKEERSLAARYLALDRKFIVDAGLKSTVPAAPEVKKNVTGIPPTKSTKAVCGGRGSTAGKKATAQPTAAQPLDDEVWINFGLDIERIVKGFIEDAANPLSNKSNTKVPGLKKGLNELLATPVNGGSYQEISKHLETLHVLLWAILASQREGYSVFGEQLCKRIIKSLSRDKRQHTKSFTLGKEVIDVSEVAKKAKSVYSKAESSGLAEQIVRLKLLEKVKLIKMKE